MLTSIKQITLMLGLSLSILACAAEQEGKDNPSHQSSRFIVQLTTLATEQSPEQQTATLQQWEKDSGVTLTLVPPTNSQRWIIETKSLTNKQKKLLISIVSQDSDVSYIEEDSVMRIMPIQRPFPVPQQQTH